MGLVTLSCKNTSATELVGDRLPSYVPQINVSFYIVTITFDCAKTLEDP